VGSDFPGISEIILDEENGLLFEPGNTTELTKQLSRLIGERGLAERLSANSRQPKSIACYVDELLGVWETRGNKNPLQTVEN
jgi:glycosyltransferase involved in cell wall biosynthesis